MFIKVCPDTGFNSDAVAHWNFELVPPPELPPPPPPAARAAAGRSDVSRAEASRLEASRSATEREDDDKDKETPRAGRDAVVTPQEEVPVPQPTPTLTLYFIGGGELVLTDADATKVQAYFSVPSAVMTVL